MQRIVLLLGIIGIGQRSCRKYDLGYHDVRYHDVRYTISDGGFSVAPEFIQGLSE